MENDMALSGEMTASAFDALLRDGKLAGRWTLDPSRSKISLRSKSMWGLVAVKGVFGQVEGHGTVSAAGAASGTITVASASIDTKMKKRD
jgi:polyisoprenoid-binding protein YceI